MRILLDANVLIAAFAARGLCAEIFARVLRTHDLAVSEELLRETAVNLRKKIRLPEKQIGDILAFLRESGTVTAPAAVKADACRDPSDLHVLGLAKAAECDLIVTGDDDLLDLKRFGRTSIISPREFWLRHR